MRILPAAAVATAFLPFCLMPVGHVSAAGQEAVPVAPHHVLGYQDSQTGAFHPLQMVVPEAVTAPIAGTITLTLHITLKTAVAAGSKVACSGSVDASFSSVTGSTAYFETAAAFASVSGSTATCIVTIPHSWQFPAKTATDIEILSGSYSAEIINPTAVQATQVLVRESSSNFVSLTGNNIFATAPSTFSVNVTL